MISENRTRILSNYCWKISWLLLWIFCVRAENSLQKQSDFKLIYFKGSCSSQQYQKCAHFCFDSQYQSLNYFCECKEGFELSPNGYSCLKKQLDKSHESANRLPPELEMKLMVFPKAPVQPFTIDATPPDTKSISLKRTKRQEHQSASAKLSRTTRETLAPVSYYSNKCNQNSCLHGVCYQSQMGGESYCLCSLRYKGPYCEYSRTEMIAFPEFEMEGAYMKLYDQIFNDTQFRITLTIRPGQRTGLLLYRRPQTGFNLLVALDNGYFVFRFTTTNETIQVRSKEAIAKGNQNWYKLEIERTGSEAKILVDDRYDQFDRLKLEPREMETDLDKIERTPFFFLGGHPDMKTLPRRDSRLFQSVDVGFIGCVQSFFINGRSIDMRLGSFVGSAISGLGIKDCAKDICLKHKCINNGNCHVISPRDYECRCSLGYKGKYCETLIQVKMPRFTGNSYMIYAGLKDTSKSHTKVVIIFKPEQATGLLLYQGYSEDKRGDFLAISLFNAQVHVTFDLGTGPKTLKSSQTVKLQKWNKIRFRREGRTGYLQVNEGREITANTFGNQLQLTLRLYLFIGGHDNYDHVSYFMNHHTGFIGCIQTIYLNGKPLKLVTDAESGTNVDNCPHQCSHKTDQCSGAGDCVPIGEDYSCACNLGFLEDHCQSSIKIDVIKQPEFNGNSYLQFTKQIYISKLSSKRFNISLTVRLDATSNSNNGVLLYLTTGLLATQSRHFVLKISKKLQLTASAKNGGWKSVISNSIRLTPNIFNSIIISRESDQYIIYINETKIAHLRILQGSLYPEHFQALFIGGVNQTIAAKLDLIGYTGITGCISQILLDGKPLIIADASDGRSVGQCQRYNNELN